MSATREEIIRILDSKEKTIRELETQVRTKKVRYFTENKELAKTIRTAIQWIFWCKYSSDMDENDHVLFQKWAKQVDVASTSIAVENSILFNLAYEDADKYGAAINAKMLDNEKKKQMLNRFQMVLMDFQNNFRRRVSLPYAMVRQKMNAERVKLLELVMEVEEIYVRGFEGTVVFTGLVQESQGEPSNEQLA